VDFYKKKQKTNEQFSLKSSIKFSNSQSTISVIHVKPQNKTKSVIKTEGYLNLITWFLIMPYFIFSWIESNIAWRFGM